MEDYMEEIPRDQFIKHYMEVRQQTFKDTTIRAAFRKTGIWPINRDAFADADFAPSVNTSTSARDVPDSYPVHTDAWPNHHLWSDDNPILVDEDEDDDSGEQREQAHQPTVSLSLQIRQPALPAVAGSSRTPTASDLDGPTPIARFYTKVPKPVCHGRNTEAYISALENQVGALCQENEELATHATLAYDYVRALKHRLNTKLPGSKRRKLNVDSRWLNSEEGLAQCEKQEAEERAETKRKQARADERQAAENERQSQREKMDPNQPFVGALNSRKKADLQDIAYSLGLDIEGKVDEIKSRISEYFNTHEDRHTSPRYIGLYPQLARQNHTPQLHIPTPIYTSPDALGPSNWPSGNLGYVAHNPPRNDNVNTYTYSSIHWP
jgi:hypothetical protein